MEWTTQNIKWFFEQSPPRQVDGTLLNDTLNIFFPKIVRVLFPLLPVLILVITGILLTFLMRTADLKGQWRLLTGPTAHTSGKVLDMEKRTGSKGSTTYIYTFEFKPLGRQAANDPPVKGACFSGDQVASSGQTVHIEYLTESPKISTIQGCRLSPIPLVTIAAIPLLTAIIAIVPVGMMRYRKKALQRLMALGVTTSATIERIKPGPKGALTIELRYELDGKELKSKTNASGRKQEKEWLTSLQESGRPVLILVDPGKPRSIFMLDLLLNSKRDER
jgi:hypothetical protein